MKKRLTVHLENVLHTTKKVEYKGEDGKLVVKDKKILVNTLSYITDTIQEHKAILDNLSNQGKTIKKYYTSNIY
jgi:hypothetical protein